MDTSTPTPSPEPGILEEASDVDHQSMSPLLNAAAAAGAASADDQHPPLQQQPHQHQSPQSNSYPYSPAPPKYASGVSDYFNTPRSDPMDQQQHIGPSNAYHRGPGHAVLSRPIGREATMDEPQLVDSIDGTPYPGGPGSSSMSLSPTISTSGIVQQPQNLTYTSTFQANTGDGGGGPTSETSVALEKLLQDFWTKQIRAAEDESQWPVPSTEWYKHPTLPLARIKKVMKSDPDVKMIGSDAPVLFAKACEMFITEVTSRAWLVASQNKRRTLSRVYVAKALAMSDQFDFLIDIVPREVQNERSRNGLGAARNAQEGGEDGDEDGDEDGAGEGGASYEGGEVGATYGAEEGDVEGEIGGGTSLEQDYDHDGEALDEGEHETETTAQ
ncbi:hypothetical protein FRB96_003804 [Tulasnella sp. 330]|nr:hypothetical protein FRB96_003804 [Tulasnella sp. 330]